MMMHSRHCFTFLVLGLVFVTTGFDIFGSKLEDKNYYPDSIPDYPIRKDSYTGDEVTRGKLHLVGLPLSRLIPENSELQRSKRVTFEELHKTFQCASAEPELDGERGAWSLIKLQGPPNKDMVELVAAWCETRCSPWLKCHQEVVKMKRGEYSKSNGFLNSRFGMFREAYMLRIIDNVVYYDWPWGIERLEKDRGEQLNSHNMGIIHMVIRAIKDIGDSVFLKGGERYSLPSGIPFPCFSDAPGMDSSDMAIPWFESYSFEYGLYQKIYAARETFDDEHMFKHHTPWDEREPKAAYFGSWQQHRQIVYDCAAKRPDLFDVALSMAPFHQPIPWNILSDEEGFTGSERDGGNLSKPENLRSYRNHIGYTQPLLRLPGAHNYNPAHYKYNIVMMGTGAASNSGKLAALLAHSGSVVLLQRTPFSYHFSERLLPWVHYVPLSYGAADLINKVEWLRQHDDFARRIARNAQNFGKSYLRMEDYYCYMSSALKMISELQKDTNATSPFSPQILEPDL